MAPVNHITEELKEISPVLARLEVSNPYRVPAGYFDNLAEMILLRIRTENSGNIKEELQLLSPLLGGLSKNTPYTVPEGYFENLVPAVKVVVPQHKGAKVVNFNAGRNKLQWLAAAVTVGIIAITVWFLFNQPLTENNQIAVNRDSVVQDEMKKRVSQISENEIVAFIENGSPIFIYENSGDGGELNAEDVRLMLADISDQELEYYLNQQSPQKEKFN